MFLKPKGQGGFILFLVLYTAAFSQESFIDILHKKISAAVHTTAGKLDSFFADPKIKEETKAYLRFRTGFEYNTSPDFKDIFRADFKIRLAKLEKSLGLYIESYREKLPHKGEEEPVKIGEEQKGNISVGVEYKPKTKFIKHKFSVGLTGSPKIYAKYQIYNKPIVYNRWEITAYQRFRVEKKLNDYRLEESTDIYIDRLIRKNTIWRIYLERYKASNVPHQTLNYSTALRIYNPFEKIYKRPTAVEFSAGINQHRLINGFVNSYTIQNKLRFNFWKKWAFFNIYTGSNWEKDRGFKGTPFIKVFFEFYFGKI